MQSVLRQDHKHRRAGFFEGASWLPQFCLLLWRLRFEDHLSVLVQPPCFLSIFQNEACYIRLDSLELPHLLLLLLHIFCFIIRILEL